jgi:hypothetical protein
MDMILQVHQAFVNGHLNRKGIGIVFNKTDEDTNVVVMLCHYLQLGCSVY